MAISNETMQTEIGNGYKNELRNIPGYTNYVVGVHKNLNGLMSSAQFKKYYSAIDAELYFNGEWVEDITSISWNVEQKTMALFGYNSYIWDDVAQGTRIISGTFTITFTDPVLIEKAISNTTAENTTKMSYEEIQSALLKSQISQTFSDEEVFENEKHYHIWESRSGRDTQNGFKIYKGFDIDIVCGEKGYRNENPVHIILKNCVIQSMGTMRAATGGAAAIEQYSFIAQDCTRIK